MGDVVGGPWKVKCAGRSKRTGEPCQNWAVRGGKVCSTHGQGGGNKPSLDERTATAAAVRLDRLAQARDRMESLVDRAVDAVVNVMENDEARPADRMKAAEMILDRSLPRKLEVEAHDELRDLDDEIATELGEVRALAATGTDENLPASSDLHDDAGGDGDA